MGTYYTLQYWSEERVSAHEIDGDVQALLDQFENELSNWREDSWVNQFNHAGAGEVIPMPDVAFQVVSLSLDLAEKSDGLLDPTAGPLIELWGFGTDRNVEIPSQSSIDQISSQVGYDKLKLDPVERTLQKSVTGVQLNCSAVAKGFAVDLIAERLAANGIENHLINIGGEVKAEGTHLDSEPWKVGIRQPVFQGRVGKTLRSIELHNQALATSGHSQRSFEKDGKRYSHILNPKTGHPVPLVTASATVMAPTCALADGLATLALILNETQMTELTESFRNIEVHRTSWAIDDFARRN
ncbi:MAG: FAD:protein FMN transferase [Opitutales bacterium]|jgi:thiamine biosynthesis lipoprotein|nr:FAD:protein FMN transferase [Opitutales bacterium]